MQLDWEQLINALADFDQKSAPAGLYAPEERFPETKLTPRLQIDWTVTISPALKSLGCSRMSSPGREPFTFTAPDKKPGKLQVVRCSKIKVRKYGNAYRIDPHNDFSARWAEANLAGSLASLWKGYYDYELLLFIGFSAEMEPFERELEDLKETTGWPKRPLDFFERTWADPHKRKFNTYIALWVHEPDGAQRKYLEQ